mgnify:CR=1 FL=1
MQGYYEEIANMALNIKSKEFQALQKQFEKDIQNYQYIYVSAFLEREKDGAHSGYFYCNGEINKLFHAYMLGYEYAKSLAMFDELPI